MAIHISSDAIRHGSPSGTLCPAGARPSRTRIYVRLRFATAHFAARLPSELAIGINVSVDMSTNVEFFIFEFGVGVVYHWRWVAGRVGQAGMVAVS